MYDTKCYDLAEHFLPSGIDEKIKGELADLIQTAIESFIEYGEHKRAIAQAEAYEHNSRSA